MPANKMFFELMSIKNPEEYEAAKEKFILFNMPTVKKHAARFTAAIHASDGVTIEEVIQICSETMLAMIDRARHEPQYFAKFKSWYGCLYWESRQKVRAYCDKNRMKGMGGGVSLERRNKAMRMMEQKLINEGNLFPTPKQIVDAVNAEMLANRKDPKRSMDLCTLRDFALKDAMLSSLSAYTQDSPAPNIEDTSLLDCSHFLSQLVTIVEEESSSEYGKAYVLYWYRSVMENYVPTPHIISRETGIPLKVCLELHPLILQTAKNLVPEEIRDFYGR